MTTPAVKNSTFAGFSKKQLAGLGYLIGDAALFFEGLALARLHNKDGTADERREYDNAMKGAYAGLSWAVGGLAMFRYGNRPVPKQMEVLEAKLADYFAQQGVTLTPELLRKAQTEKDKSLWAKIEDFLFQYPTEVLNAVYAAGAVGLVQSGLSKAMSKDKEYGVLGMGVLILSGALTGLLFKDKMKTTGTLYALNNGFTALGTYEAYQNFNHPEKNKDPALAELYGKKKDDPLYKNLWMFKGVTTASYLFSNLTLRTVSTGSDAAEDVTGAAQKEILKTSAAVINAQPAAERERLILQTARYLSARRELNFGKRSIQEVAEMITQNLEQYAAKSAGEAAPSDSAKTGAQAAEGSWVARKKEEAAEAQPGAAVPNF